MARPKKEKKVITDLPLLRWLNDNNKLADLRIMLNIKEPKDMWRGIIAVPPGSIMDKIIHEFDAHSDIPLEIPFFQLIHLVAGYLLNNGIVAEINSDDYSDTIKPDLWTLIFASSGAGKTYSWKQMRKLCPEILDTIEWQDFTGIKSGAAFVESLANNNNNKLIVRDEYNEFYKKLHSVGPMEDFRDYLFAMSNNETITRQTKKDYFQIKNTAACFVGMTVGESFVKYLCDDDGINGFIQRFAPVCAISDPNRNPRDFSLYRVNTAQYNEQFTRLLQSAKHKKYIVDDEALSGYDTTWRTFFPQNIGQKSSVFFDNDTTLSTNQSQTMSFYRRLLWRAHKYALIYHIITGQGNNPNLSAIDYGWAARVVHMHIVDNANILSAHGLSELQKKLNAVERFCQTKRDNGQHFTLSDVVRGVRCVSSVPEVKYLLQISHFGNCE